MYRGVEIQITLCDSRLRGGGFDHEVMLLYDIDYGPLGQGVGLGKKSHCGGYKEFPLQQYILGTGTHLFIFSSSISVFNRLLLLLHLSLLSIVVPTQPPINPQTGPPSSTFSLCTVAP